MTILEIINEFCRRTAIPTQAAVATSRDEQSLQLLGLCNELLDDLGERKAWTMGQVEATFISLAAEDQGVLTALASQGFVNIIDNLIFDRTVGEVIPGSVSPTDWQAAKANLAPISDSRYRQQGGHLYITPAPSAGNTIAFEYVSSYPVLEGTIPKPYFTKDTDTSIYPDKLLILGLRWLWKREKGIRYSEEFRNYEIAVTNLMGKDSGAQPINMAEGSSGLRPGISVPEGSWSV
jgi:hypothetical protein